MMAMDWGSINSQANDKPAAQQPEAPPLIPPVEMERPVAKAGPVRGALRSYPRKTPLGGPLFSRNSTDRARPIVVGMLAFLFLGLSWVSTTVQVGVLLAAGGVKLSPIAALIIGLATAALITICEIVFSESVWYWPFLAVDVALTLWWIWPPFLAWSVGVGAGVYGALVAGGMIGVVGAYLPERVLFGRRRK